MPESPWSESDDLSPPRELDGGLRRRLLLGGLLSQVGWGMLAFGLLFVQVFGSWIDLDELVVFRGDMVLHEARVLDSEISNFSINGQSMFGTRFTWDAEDGPATDMSWSMRALEEGEVVTVESPSSRPHRARILGQRSEPFPSWVILVILPLPAAGFAITLFGLRRGRRSVQLLVHGEFAEGSCVEKVETNTRINDCPVMAYTFAFEDAHGDEHHAVAKTHKSELLSESEPEPLVYAPELPEHALLLNVMPGRPALSSLGVEAGTHGTQLFLVLPALTILGHSGVFLLRALM